MLSFVLARFHLQVIGNTPPDDYFRAACEPLKGLTGTDIEFVALALPITDKYRYTLSKFALAKFLSYAHLITRFHSVTDALRLPVPESESPVPVPAYDRSTVVSDLSILLQFRNCSYCGSFGAREALLTCADCGESYHRCV